VNISDLWTNLSIIWTTDIIYLLARQVSFIDLEIAEKQINRKLTKTNLLND
jgi:hypothetical protein